MGQRLSRDRITREYTHFSVQYRKPQDRSSARTQHRRAESDGRWHVAPSWGEAASSTAVAASSIKHHSVLAVGLLACLEALVQLLVLAADDDEHRISLPERDWETKDSTSRARVEVLMTGAPHQF